MLVDSLEHSHFTQILCNMIFFKSKNVCNAGTRRLIERLIQLVEILPTIISIYACMVEAKIWPLCAYNFLTLFTLAFVT